MSTNGIDGLESIIGTSEHPLTRRAMLARIGGGIASVSMLGALSARAAGAATVMSASGAEIGGTLAFLGWQGYDDKSAVGAWLKKNGVKLKTSYIAANDDIITKLRSGGVGQFDVCTPFIAYVPPLIKLKLIEPIPLKDLPNFRQLFPQFRSPSVKGIAAPKGSVYSVPLDWGAFTLLYSPKDVKPPKSWLQLLSPQYKGKVIMYDDAYSQIVVWAKAMGFLKPGSANLTKDQLKKVRDSLIQLKKNARTIVPNYGEMTDLFARGEGWVATSGWDAVIAFAAAKGATVRSTIPKEGTFSWTDTYALVRDAPNRDSAVAFINQVVSVQAQKAFAPVLYSGVTNRVAANALPRKLRKLYPYGQINAYFRRAPLAAIPPLTKAGNIATLQDWQSAWAKVKQA
jgi:spermidine/putrescine transport system substrate-binding protein